jgi:hypothetical protein
MNRMLAAIACAMACIAVAATPAFAQTETRQAQAKSAREAEAQFFPESDSTFTDGYTSHFNFDNRRLPSDSPTTNKYRCMVECKLDDGRTVWHSNPPTLNSVRVGELKVLQIDSYRERVVKFRFWWKLSNGPLARWYDSGWTSADDGYYIVYAFLVWKGYNDFEKPIYVYQEPLDNGGLARTASTRDAR